jgi:hypothetical protein
LLFETYQQVCVHLCALVSDGLPQFAPGFNDEQTESPQMECALLPAKAAIPYNDERHAYQCIHRASGARKESQTSKSQTGCATLKTVKGGFDLAAAFSLLW